jgi:hypothetical protein
VHTEKSLTLVFEYLEKDLKQYMDDCGAILSMNNVKVCYAFMTHIEVCHKDCNVKLSYLMFSLMLMSRLCGAILN